jgi:hypothetical protein
MKELITNFDAGLVHPLRDGRAPVIDLGSQGTWKLTKVAHFRCTRCGKVYLNCQDYRLYLSPYDVVDAPYRSEGLCNKCIDWLHD